MKNKNKTWTPKQFLLGLPTDTKLVQMNITGCGWCNLLAVFFSWWITLWIFTGNLPTFSKLILNTYRLCSITLLFACLLDCFRVNLFHHVNLWIVCSSFLLCCFKILLLQCTSAPLLYFFNKRLGGLCQYSSYHPVLEVTNYDHTLPLFSSLCLVYHTSPLYPWSK